MLLDEVIERLEDARKLYGNIPVTLCVEPGANEVPDGRGVYNVQDVIADVIDVTLYNW